MREAACWVLGMWALLQSLAVAAKLWAAPSLPWWAVAAPTLTLAVAAVAYVLYAVAVAVTCLYGADDCEPDCKMEDEP